MTDRASSVTQGPANAAGAKRVVLPAAITVQDLAALLGVSAIDLIKALMRQGIMASLTQTIDYPAAALAAQQLGFTPEPEQAPPVAAPRTLQELLHEPDPSALQPRPPVVAVLGHVDHGKTTLLDTIRNTNVTAREVGGITQRIGAYQVEFQGQRITFIDTPGHEAFTAMRARGAQVTDIVVLVVAADDGVMPQTVEAVDHARAAGVPIVVAINKIDRPEADVERVKRQLAELNLVIEEWGGDTICVPISARTGEGVRDLLENILVLAEVSELRANPHRPAVGAVLDAELDKNRGPLATVLVRTGTLRVGDYVVVGATWGKVRALLDDAGRRVQEAGPSMPVKLMGLEDVPQAGDILQVVKDERTARELAEEQRQQQAREGFRAITLESFAAQVQAGQARDLNLIIKADFQGSIDAILNALQRLEQQLGPDAPRIHILHAAPGLVTESDILLAEASKAIIVGFNTRPAEPGVLSLAERSHVEVRFYQIIYQLIDEMERVLRGLREPVYREVTEGRAEVRQVFRVRGNAIAGCWVREGRLVRGAPARLLRDGRVLSDTRIASLRHFKEDVREMAAGFECGVGLDGVQDFQEGDIIECYRRERVS